MESVDIAIVGAGPVGLAFARSLAGSGLSIALIEQQPHAAVAEPAFDGREIALTHASRELMEALGWWARLPQSDVAPLRQAKVMDGEASFALDFEAPARDGEPLGWLVPNHQIRRAAWESVEGQARLQWLDGLSLAAVAREPQAVRLRLSDGRELRSRLLVAADSRFSATRRLLGIGARQRDFGKSMLVCRVRHAQPHRQTAWEWFGHGRTMALLPLRGDRAGAVLTLPPARIAELQAMDEAAFGAAVSACFQHRLGAMHLESGRHVYPLVGVYADRFVAPRAALIGDAAVGMHPVTAHGFNFGLQGQARLARQVLAAQAEGGDIGAEAGLLAYERTHRRATLPLYEATNAIAALYTDERRPARWLREAALRVAARVGPFKRAIAGQLTQRKA